MINSISNNFYTSTNQFIEILLTHQKSIMTQKVNPISTRLGTTQVWDYTFQVYGKFNKDYHFIFYKVFQMFNLFSYIHSYLKLQIGSKAIKFSKNWLLLNLYFLYSDDPSLKHVNLNQISNVIFKWFRIKVFFRPYLKTNRFFSTRLISNYAQHLLINNVSPNKVLRDICYFFEQMLDSEKVVNSVKGPARSKLKGFRISLAGRFDRSSKNQMARLTSQKIGSLPLSYSKSHVEYLNTDFFTKLGTCGIRIWLFYEIY